MHLSLSPGSTPLRLALFFLSIALGHADPIQAAWIGDADAYCGGRPLPYPSAGR